MNGDDLAENEYMQHGFTKFLQKPVLKKAFEKLMDLYFIYIIN
jgi:hypothetical protein